MQGGGDLVKERGATIVTNDMAEPEEKQWKAGNNFKFDQEPAGGQEQ